MGRLAKSDPGNASWQRDLAVCYNKVGDVQAEQGDLPAALTSYQADLSIMERLAKSDAGNAGWQDGLSVSYDRVGEVQVSQGNLAGALTAFQAAFAIRDRLAKSDPRQCRPAVSLDGFLHKNRRRADRAGQLAGRAGLLSGSFRDHRPAGEVGWQQRLLAA
jgi:tetratricopeptide (TPR) repeat protein